MKERIAIIRKEPALIGILTEPSPTSSPASNTAIILVNAGVVHRVGPNRLHVRLSRTLASAGFPVLRFDLSGLGDSDARADAMSFLESAPLDSRMAMDYLSKSLGVRQFVVAGICSGAGTSFLVATQDPRVVGAVLIDAPALPTLEFRIRYYLRRIGHWSSWRNTFAGRNSLGRRLRGGRGPASVGRVEDAALARMDRGGDVPTREAVAQKLTALIDRGVQLCLVFSGVPSNYNYQRQFQDSFPEISFRNRVKVAYYRDVDHTFSGLHMQDRLVSMLTSWAQGLFSNRRGGDVAG